jgi:Asp-tRNA(Asn)/Glu-tRNA(Gln) amidotransferase A subunit family amidase
MKRDCKLRGYVALADAFRSGGTTPRAYLDETLSLIDRHDSRIKAFVATNREGAIAAADASTARWRNDAPFSPIDGMPIAVKDVIETIDLPRRERARAARSGRRDCREDNDDRVCFLSCIS